VGLAQAWHARTKSDNQLEWILSCPNPSSRRIWVSRSVNCPSGSVHALRACIRSRSPKSKNSPSGPSLCFRPMSSPFLAHAGHAFWPLYYKPPYSIATDLSWRPPAKSCQLLPPLPSSVTGNHHHLRLPLSNHLHQLPTTSHSQPPPSLVSF
jgi:hypothetical protein